VTASSGKHPPHAVLIRGVALYHVGQSRCVAAMVLRGRWAISLAQPCRWRAPAGMQVSPSRAGTRVAHALLGAIDHLALPMAEQVAAQALVAFRPRSCTHVVPWASATPSTQPDSPSLNLPWMTTASLHRGVRQATARCALPASRRYVMRGSVYPCDEPWCAS